MIDAGSEVNAVDKSEWTVYHFSAMYGSHDVLQVLINHDVTCINDVNYLNETPLHLATIHGSIECEKLLLSALGVDGNIQNNWNKTAHDVARDDHVKQLFQVHSFKHCSNYPK